VKEGVKEVQIAGGEGREVVIIRMDSWERKEEIMRRKKNLEAERYILITTCHRRKENCKGN